MIKFFRKIRQRLLTENKFSKYLIYAIGEIVLVVIGILIALTLNNWNEEKKNENLVLGLVDNIEKDLIDNYNNANQVLAFYRSQDSICKMVLHDKLTINDYLKNDVLSIVAVDWDQLVPITENLEKFLAQEKSVPKRLKPLLDGINLLHSRKTEVDDNWNILKGKFQENMKLMTNKVLFSSIDSLSKKKRYQYMLTDPQYKRIVDLYWIHAQVYYDQTSKYRAQTMAVLGTIKMLKENYDRKELDELFQTHGMSPFVQVDCYSNEQSKNEYNEIRRGFLIGNLTGTELKLRISNSNSDFILSMNLKPNEFKSSPNQYIGLEGNYNLNVEYLDNSGNCLQKFASAKKGYLLIENEK